MEEGSNSQIALEHIAHIAAVEDIGYALNLVSRCFSFESPLLTRSHYTGAHHCHALRNADLDIQHVLHLGCNLFDSISLVQAWPLWASASSSCSLRSTMRSALFGHASC